MYVISPIDGNMEKLEADLQKQKEKAEKTARALVISATRRNQTRENKENKKKRKAEKDIDDPLLKLQMEVDARKADLEKIQSSEQEEKHVQAAISKALASQSEPVERSARAKAMQDAVKNAEIKLQSMKSDVSSTRNGDGAGGGQGGPTMPTSSEMISQDRAVGLQAALNVLRRQGTLAQKNKVIKGKKDDKALTAHEMKRLGKHLLK